MTKDELFLAVKKQIGFGDETSRRMFDEWCQELEEEGIDITADAILKKIDEFHETILDCELESDADDIAYVDED